MSADNSGAPILYNTDEWIKENSKFFAPPVCNKMMHQAGQIQSFFVGGPNQRKDYHIEEGEELFYMVKGDMCLKVLEQDKHVDIPIKEGEIFLLPSNIAHSPQRQKDTVGLVIERLREKDEQDGLRYFVEKDGKPTSTSLYEEWFHCTDLGTQIAAAIKGFFASEQYKTGQPVPGTIPENPPVKLNSKLKLQMPFNLKGFIEKNRQTINEKGFINLFEQLENYEHQFKVFLYGKGETTEKSDVAETFIWILEGSKDEPCCTVNSFGIENSMKLGDSLLVKQGQQYTATLKDGCIALICYQDPTKKKKIE